MNAFHTAGFLFFYSIADFFSSGLKLFCSGGTFGGTSGEDNDGENQKGTDPEKMVRFMGETSGK